MREVIAEMDHVACEAHRALVARAFADDATDDEVARYAAEVPTCPACRAARREPSLVRFQRAMNAPVPAARLPWIGAAGIALAVAIVLSALRSPEPPVTRVAPPPALAPALPPPPPAVASPDLPPATEPEVAAAPSPAVQALADAVANALEEAVADARPGAGDDWPRPPYVDLRGGGEKAGAPANAVRLELSGEAALGDSVGLAVVTGVPTELAVCVSGPRRGVVWRGAVPAGRTTLSRDGHAERFRFEEPGAWRFALSTDPEGCAAPVHTVDIVVE